MTTYYLGTTESGALVARSSTRNYFTHAAIAAGEHKAGEVIRADQSCWSGTAAAAAANFKNGYRHSAGPIEIVAVRIVTPAEYRQAIRPSSNR